METWKIVTMSRKEARRAGLVQLAVALRRIGLYGLIAVVLLLLLFLFRR
jgi:hypothetical protein